MTSIGTPLGPLHRYKGQSVDDRDRGPVGSETLLSSFEDIRVALFNKDLSRSFDKRSFEEGNLRAGVVSIMHGQTHRNRRRIENSQFRVDELAFYEGSLFPPVLDAMLQSETVRGESDLFHFGEIVSVVLAAKRAGFDLDATDSEAVSRLVRHVDAFSQLSAILDAVDPEGVKERALSALEAFRDEFGHPSLQRRMALAEGVASGRLDESELPHDILMNLARNRSDMSMEFSDDFNVIREAATYLQGGTHTSSVTLVNAIDLLIENRAARPDDWARVKNDLAFCQRVVHETLRLRPTTPRARRLAEVDTRVSGHDIREGGVVLLDLVSANRDVSVFGSDADAFNPDRVLDAKVPRWGHSFGAGPHICPGRAVAGGLPQDGQESRIQEHLFGLIALMLQRTVQAEPRRHPVKPQERDTTTERYTRWKHYWVQFGDSEGRR